MDKSLPLYGMYRARVVDNKDTEFFGRVLVWIPDVMPEVEPDTGLWARPANNPLGGRNDENEDEHHYMGSSYIPKIGSWVFVFFECGDINRPYYFGSLDLENTPVLPENQLGNNYEDKWTVIKTHRGRCIVISDDEDDERVEFTGKKREISNPPTGDKTSVYKIDDNMTTILLDERSGKEKVLIRTVKGDFFHIDIDEQKLQISFASDIHIRSGENIYITSEKDMHLGAMGDLLNIQCVKEVNIKAGSDLNVQTQDNMSFKSGGTYKLESSGRMDIKTSDELRILGTSGTHVVSSDKLNIKSSGDMNLNSGAMLNGESSTEINLKSGTSMNREAGSAISDTASGTITLYGSGISEMTSPGTPAGSADSALSASGADDAESAVAAQPEGERDT